MSTGLELSKKYKTRLDLGGIDTPIRLAHFFAQIDHESGLKPVRESLYYTKVSGARSAFYTPFKGKTDAFIQGYLKNSVKMANYVYANRMGNGNEASGDGFKYRGGGYLQHTGKNEYTILTKNLKVNYVDSPDLLINEADAMIAAIDGWNRRNLNPFADDDDLDAISDIINIGSRTKAYGDANGFPDRKKKLDFYKKEFKVK